MSLKSDGKQFLLNIKPKYRKSVTPILQMLKENREASDFVCQAILEKVARDGITSIESQVEVLLEGNAELLTPRKESVKTPSPFVSARTQVSATVEQGQDIEEKNQKLSPPLPDSNQELRMVESSESEVVETKELQGDVSQPPTEISSSDNENEENIQEKTVEPLSENLVEKENSINKPTNSNDSTNSEVEIEINGKKIKPKEVSKTPKSLASSLFEMD